MEKTSNALAIREEASNNTARQRTTVFVQKQKNLPSLAQIFLELKERRCKVEASAVSKPMKDNQRRDA